VIDIERAKLVHLDNWLL